MDYEKIGERLKSGRKGKHLGQQAVAIKTGMRQADIPTTVCRMIADANGKDAEAKQ